MPTIPEPPAARPSVFLSYASEDRPAVRALRDALAAAGLEVWYDENELTGGDAWDRKIRRQIRECTYFMPIISATTNARAEGYFRREWRMGVERTQDMADDVIYILPVTIDDVDEGTARVPEQFLRVQWMRTVGGQPTSALNDLCHRLVSGGSHQMQKPAATAPRATNLRSTPPPPRPTGEAETREDHDLAPPVGKEWWLWLRRVWRKMPRWVRFCMWGVFVISALDTCTRCSNSNRNENQNRKAAAVVDALAKNPGVTTGNFDAAAFKKTMQETIKAAAEVRAAARKPTTAWDLDLLTFTGAQNISQAVFNQLVAVNGVRTHLSPLPLKGTEGDSTPVERGRADGARLVLSGNLTKSDGDGRAIFRAVLKRVSDGETLWTQDFDSGADATLTASQICSQVIPLALKKDSADLDLLTFTGGPLASKVFADLAGKYSATDNLKTHVSTSPLKGTPGDTTPVDRAKRVGARLVLSGTLGKNAGGDESLHVVLQQASDGKTLWSADYDTDDKPAEIASEIYEAALPFILKKE